MLFSRVEAPAVRSREMQGTPFFVLSFVTSLELISCGTLDRVQFPFGYIVRVKRTKTYLNGMKPGSKDRTRDANF